MALLVSAPPLLVSVLMPMPNSGDLRVLFVSDYSDDAVRWKGESLDERALLPKPFTSRELARRIRVMLDQSPRVS
jgi:DNA-binding response OmpR family regulator